MLRHIRDFYALNQTKTKTNNKENVPKVANSAYVLRIYGRLRFVSQWLAYGFCRRDMDQKNDTIFDLLPPAELAANFAQSLLQPNSLYRAVRFANFEGIWVFLFRQSSDWGRG